VYDPIEDMAVDEMIVKYKASFSFGLTSQESEKVLE
jgi:hypothetical protein